MRQQNPHPNSKVLSETDIRAESYPYYSNEQNKFVHGSFEFQ